jgi:hypothetical protein
VQISSILDIVDGELLNSPSISFIYSIKTNVSKVKEGDLFIVRNKDDIQTAINNGAFALVLEDNHFITDNEIAWIKVKNINTSIIQLIRFKLAISDLEAYYCDEVTFDLLKIFANNSLKNIVFIPKNIDKLFKQIEDINHDDVIICSNKTILDKIYPNNKSFSNNNSFIKIENLVEHSLFECSFSFNDIYFQKIKIPSIYIKELISVYKFLDYEFDFSKLKSFTNFKPIFLDKSMNLLEFGRSDKFIICQKNIDLVKREISYIKTKYKYAKTLFITSSYLDILEINEQIILDNLENLKSMLKTSSFNAVYLINYNFDDVYDYLQKEEKPLTLF